jgi:hypothetical protein
MVTRHSPSTASKRISLEAFDDWRRRFFSEARHSKETPHPGHSFCEHFQIDDSVIFHTPTPAAVIVAAMDRYLVRP